MSSLCSFSGWGFRDSLECRKSYGNGSSTLKRKEPKSTPRNSESAKKLGQTHIQPVPREELMTENPRTSKAFELKIPGRPQMSST